MINGNCAKTGMMSGQEYLAWEPLQSHKYEYVNGDVYAMTGGTLAHNAIAVNLVSLLRNHLRGSGCHLFMSDVKVEVDVNRAYFYPDVLVTCDQRDRSAKNLVKYPCLIIEVLSPSTEGYDRGEKFKHYRSLSSLQEYILINPEAMEIDCFRLNQWQTWELIPYGIGDGSEAIQVEFPCLGFSCPLELIYEDVQLGSASIET